MKSKLLIHKQQGQVAILTALVLLFSITLISLLTSKTVLVETQITADNYRTSQASAAASAAMDQAVAYFSAGGLDQHDNATPATLTVDCKVDYIGSGNNLIKNGCSGVSNVVVIVPAEPTASSCLMPTTTAVPPLTAFPLTLVSGTKTTLAHFYFNNTDDNACDCKSSVTEDIDGDGDGDCMGTLGTNMTRALVTAKGWSDDCTAVRTITQCVGTFDIFRSGEGPKQSFVSKAGVGAFGNATIINRYNNSSIWTGGADAVHGASYGTYLRPSSMNTTDYTTAQLDSADLTNTQLVSNRDAGNGIDVVTNDPTLASKTTSTTNLTDPAQNQFFDLFFAQTKAEIKNAANAVGQMLAADGDPTGLTGLIWVNGPAGLNGGTVGSATNPAVLIIDGDFTLTGNPTIFGVIYVTGEVKITGNPIVLGSFVAENGPSTGAGSLKLVYKPWGDGTNQSPPFITGTGTVIAGSWKDW